MCGYLCHGVCLLEAYVLECVYMSVMISALKHLRICVHVRMHACSTYVCTYVCMYGRMLVMMSSLKHLQVCVGMRVCVCVCVCLCVRRASSNFLAFSVAVFFMCVAMPYRT
jgi:hypothetical protein